MGLAKIGWRAGELLFPNGFSAAMALGAEFRRQGLRRQKKLPKKELAPRPGRCASSVRQARHAAAKKKEKNVMGKGQVVFAKGSRTASGGIG